MGPIFGQLGFSKVQQNQGKNRLIFRRVQDTTKKSFELFHKSYGRTVNMSRLSLSRNRAKVSGPMTSTQAPQRTRGPPVEGKSREDLLFYRQFEEALKRSR